MLVPARISRRLYRLVCLIQGFSRVASRLPRYSNICVFPFSVDVDVCMGEGAMWLCLI